CTRQRNAVLQSTDRAEITHVSSAGGYRILSCRKPQRAVFDESKSARHHAYNRRGLVIDCEGLRQDVVVGTEALLPQLITQNDGRFSVSSIFISRKVTAEHRLSAEHIEEIRTGPGSENLLGVMIEGDAECPLRCYRREALEDVVLFLEV